MPAAPAPMAPPGQSTSPQPIPLRMPAHDTFTGKVVGLSEGDTLSVLRKGQAVTVRLHGIDTPESTQAFGIRARQFASALAFQQVVTVLVRDTDRSGDVVGEVLFPDGRSLSQELVKAGMAWWSRQSAPYETPLQWLEEEARQEERGLWSDPHAVPPWKWREWREQR
jgi:endonuclease YncB( thermonuclease family)